MGSEQDIGRNDRASLTGADARGGIVNQGPPPDHGAPEPPPPPHSLEAERAVLGAVIFENDSFDTAASLIDASMFWRDAHRRVWTTISGLRDKKVGVDLVTLVEDLKRTNELDEVGGPSYVASLIDNTYATNIEHYANIIRDKAMLRRVIRASHENIRSAQESQATADEVVDKAISRIAQVGEQTQRVEFEDAHSWMVGVSTKIAERIDDPRHVTGVSSGIYKLDEHTRGFQPGSLVYVGARPGVGKSAFALQIGLYAAQHGFRTLYFSLEMSKEELGIRAVALEANVDAFRLATGHVSQYEQQLAAAAWSRIAEWPFEIADTHHITAPRLRAMVRRKHARDPVHLVIVDYIQLLKDGESHFSRNSELEAISRGFKTLSLDLGIPLVVLSQLSRPGKEHRGPAPRPRLTDLRDSGALEQDADTVVLLHRLPVKEEDAGNVEDAEIIIAKQRSGPVGMVNMHFIGTTTRWKERVITTPEKQQPLEDREDQPWR
jgi:replicative DNA helicase